VENDLYIYGHSGFAFFFLFHLFFFLLFRVISCVVYKRVSFIDFDSFLFFLSTTTTAAALFSVSDRLDYASSLFCSSVNTFLSFDCID